ncbi:hypothetical protein HDV02_004698, partial [Globomyces sp. JEL0801]
MISNELLWNQKGLIAWSIATLITLGVFTGGISDQLQFGNQAICLLNIQDYRKDASESWVFEAHSGHCSTAISYGWMGIFLLFASIGTRFYFLYKKEEPSRTVLMVLASAASFWAFVSLIMGFVVSGGVAHTCEQFEKSGKSCGAVFGEGFYANNKDVVYKKNINTINAATGSGWALVLFWIMYAAYEWHSYRHASLKW